MKAEQFADLDLSRRLEIAEGRAGAAFVDARAAHGIEVGACWTETAGVLAMFDGPASPVTQTFGLGLFDEITADHLKSIEEFFFSREANVDHEISPHARKELWGLLSERGYHPIEFTNVMYIEIADYRRPEISDDIEVRRATDDHVPIWAATAAEGWAEQGQFTGTMQVMAASKCVMPFLAKIEGQPVATAALCVHDDIALLAGGSTIPSARRRGAQKALLQSRLWHAEGMGCRIAMMGAEPGSESQRNAERVGFRVAYTRTKWRRKYV